MMYQTSENIQLLRRVLWINAQLTIVWSLKHHSTQPILIFNRENPQNWESPNGSRRGLDFIALDDYDDYNQGGGSHEYSDEYGDNSFDSFEQESNPVLKMMLSKDNRRRIEERLENHHCKPLNPLGTGDTCQSSIECRCGEYCHIIKGICEPALCDKLHQAACEVYPGFNNK